MSWYNQNNSNCCSGSVIPPSPCSPTAQTCLQLVDSNCIIVDSAITNLGLPAGSNLTSVIQLIGQNSLIIKRFTITSPQILNSNSTPVPLLPAPGFGKVIVVQTSFARYNFLTTPYTSSHNFGLAYTEAVAVSYSISSTLISQGTNQEAIMSAVPTAEQISIENTGLSFFTNAANPTLGDGTLDLFVIYQIVSVF